MVFLIFSIETKNESNVSILHNKFVISVHKFKYSVVLKHLKKILMHIVSETRWFFFFKSTIFGCISQTRTTDYFQWKVSYNYSRKVGHECSTLNQSSLFIWHFFRVEFDWISIPTYPSYSHPHFSYFAFVLLRPSIFIWSSVLCLVPFSLIAALLIIPD